MGDGSVYECANCGRESGQSGHYDFDNDMFRCVSRHGISPTRNALGEVTVAIKVSHQAVNEDDVVGTPDAREGTVGGRRPSLAQRREALGFSSVSISERCENLADILNLATVYRRG